MNATIESAAVHSTKCVSNVSLERLDAVPEMSQNTIVLQPNGPLDHATSSEFQKALEGSLEQATDSVIVDLLWVNATDSYGIAALVAGMERAATLGKYLSFQAMDTVVRRALESAWERQRESSFGPWNDVFGNELELFLDGLQ